MDERVVELNDDNELAFIEEPDTAEDSKLTHLKGSKFGSLKLILLELNQS